MKSDGRLAFEADCASQLRDDVESNAFHEFRLRILRIKLRNESIL